MKKLLAIILFLSALNANSQNTVTLPTPTTSFTPSWRYYGSLSDTLRQTWMQTPGGSWNRVYTATEANLRFAPITGGVYLQKSNNLSDVVSKSQSWYNIGGATSPYKTLQDFSPPEIPTDSLTETLYNNGPVLVQAFSGKYLMWYRKSTSHTNAGSIYFRTSLDGKAWTAGSAILTPPSGIGYQSIGGGVTNTGRIVLSFTKNTISGNLYDAYVMYSDDEGVTWSTPLLISLNADAYGKMIVAGNGLLVLPMYAETPNVLAQVATSSDDGVTWSAPITITGIPTPGYGDETSIVYLGSNTIVAITRDLSTQEFDQYLSIDNGSTWAYQGYTTFEPSFRKVSPELSTWLTSSGRMVTLYYADRVNLVIKSVTASATDLITSGVSAWNKGPVNTLTVSGGTAGFGYPSVVHPNNSIFSLGAYYIETGAATAAKIHFFKSPAIGTQPVIFGNSLFETASFTKAHTIADPLSIPYKQYNDSTYLSLYNQGLPTNVWHGNNSGIGSFGFVNLTNEITGILGTANGGLGAALSWTSGSIPYIHTDGTFRQNNAKLYWDNTNTRLGIGTGGPLHIIHTSIDGGSNGTEIMVEDINVGNAGKANFGVTGGDAYLQAATSGKNIRFYDATAERMRLINGGLICIACTADPTSGNKLAVVGNSYFNGTGQFTGALTVLTGTPGAGGTNAASQAYADASVAAITATSPIFWNNGTKVISSQAASASLNGYVTTGTQTFAGVKTMGNTLFKQTADGGSGGVVFQIQDTNVTNAGTGIFQMYQGNLLFQAVSSGKSITFWDNAGEKMRMASGGALLINTTTDDGVNKFQVNGGAISTAWKTTGGTSAQGVAGDGTLFTRVLGTVTNVTSANSDIGVATGTSTPVLTFNRSLALITPTNTYTTSTPPSIVAGVGAGTTPSVAVAGSNQDGVIIVTTGTSPTTGIIGTITMSGSFAYPTQCTPVISGYGPNAIAVQGAVGIGGTTATTFTIHATTALAASTTYQWTYHNGGY